MDDKLQSSDDFGAFLESVQRAVHPGETNNTSSMKIMSMLAKLGEVDMAQLIVVVEMSWSDFSAGIQSLQSAGLVTVNETNQGGKVQLTNDGRQWANALTSRADDEEL